MRFLQRRFLRLRFRTWLVVFLLSPLFLCVGLNLLFSTSFGTGFLERRIEKRVGLPCRIGSVTWTPWTGVKVTEFRLLPPQACSQESEVVLIRKMVLDPSWTSMAAGKKRWDRLEFDGLKVEVSVEILKTVMSRYQRKPDSLSVGSPSVETTPPEGGGVVDDPPVAGDPETGSETPKDPGKNDPAGGQVKEPVVGPTDDFEGMVLIRDSNLRVYSESLPEVAVEFENMEGEIPLWGRERKGELKVGNLDFGENFSEKAMTIPILWKGRSLEIPEYSVKLFGLNLELVAGVRIARGMPFGLQVDLPDQNVDLSPIYFDQKPPVSIGHLRSRSVIRGYLLSPGSFHGHSVTRFSDFVFHDLLDGGDTRFNRGTASIRLSGYGILADDIRVIGDDDAVLMNGFATIGGEAAATVRVVSSPERAASHRKRVEGVSDQLSFAFEPLVTPDREFRDIRIESRSGSLMMDLGIEREWVPLFPVVRSVLGERTFETATLP